MRPSLCLSPCYSKPLAPRTSWVEPPLVSPSSSPGPWSCHSSGPHLPAGFMSASRTSQTALSLSHVRPAGMVLTLSPKLSLVSVWAGGLYTYRRLSHLDVTRTSGTMRSPFYYNGDDLWSGIPTVLAPLSSFRRIYPATTTLCSTKSKIPLFGLSRPRAMGPLHKIEWHKSGSLPDLTQSYRRLSHLDVTQTSGIGR